VAATEYMEVAVNSVGSSSLRGIPGWDEMLVGKQGRGRRLDSSTANHVRAVVRFRRPIVAA
jgi:hypothetical protein